MGDTLSILLSHLLTQIDLRLQEITQSNRQLIESHQAVTEQLTTFLKISQDIIQEMNNLETQLADAEELHDMSQLEQSRILIQQLYLQVCSIGKNLREVMGKQNSNLLYEKDFMRTVETHLETFTKRQTVIIEKWSKLETKCQHQKQGEQNFIHFKEDANKIILQTETLMREMYPIVGAEEKIKEEREDQMGKAKQLESKLNNLISEVRRRV